jgi:hypothetical protein
LRKERDLRWDREKDRFDRTRHGRKNEGDPDVDFHFNFIILGNPAFP